MGCAGPQSEGGTAVKNSSSNPCRAQSHKFCQHETTSCTCLRGQKRYRKHHALPQFPIEPGATNPEPPNAISCMSASPTPGNPATCSKLSEMASEKPASNRPRRTSASLVIQVQLDRHGRPLRDIRRRARLRNCRTPKRPFAALPKAKQMYRSVSELWRHVCCDFGG